MKNSYYGVETSGKKIVFLIDVSGSMTGRNEGNVSDKLRAEAASRVGSKIGSMIGGSVGNLVSSQINEQTTKLASAKRELKPAIMGLDAMTSFTVLTFSDTVKNWKGTLTPATDSTKALGYAYVSNLDTEGGTKALSGLRTAFSVQGVDTIFFLSDGQPSDASPDEIIRQVGKMNKNKKVKLHTIGLGDDKNAQFMKELADDNGGKYIEG